MPKTFTVELTEAQIINLRTACYTSEMRDGSQEWITALETVAKHLWDALEADKIVPPAKEA